MIPPPLAPPTLLLEHAMNTKQEPSLTVTIILDVHVVLQPLAPIALLPVERTHPVLKQIAPVLKEMARVLKCLAPVAN